MDEKSNLIVNDENKVEPQDTTGHKKLSTDNDVNLTNDIELESYLKYSGFGFFHVLLLIVVGLATAADAVEVFSVSFVLPIAGHDLDLTTARKGWLIASIFIGMLLGGYVWGSFADACGRKATLVTAMLWNGVCGLVSAFSPTYGFFLAFRLASGIGVGGSIPVAYSYVSEFFTEKQSGPLVILVGGCWQPGTIFTAFIAWALMGTEGPHSEISFYIGSLHFVHWRLFLIICTLPAFLSTISLLFLPESPAYLLNVGNYPKLRNVLGKIRKVNLLSQCCIVKQPLDSNDLVSVSVSSGQVNLSMTELSAVGPKHDDDDDHPSKPSCCLVFFTKLKQIAAATVGLFRLRYLRATLLLLIIWFIQMFGYYGLQLWFPEYFKRLHNRHCYENATALDTDCNGNMTDLKFYQDTLYTALAALPGNIAGIVLINIIGGRIQTMLAMLLSAVSVFTIWLVPDDYRAAVLGVSCVFSAVTVTVFGALNVVNTTIYDVEIRSTAFGVLTGVGRVGAILGNVMFGHLLDVKPDIPIIIVASLLTVGAICAAFLPQIYRAENRPPLEKLLYQLTKKLKQFKEKILTK